ncbi:MAG TPA: hypothetical protein VNW52_07865, partial [Burkholderiaceae bacterium]|nr:hypothetical protein [Burkholderiaceae bacterium]
NKIRFIVGSSASLISSNEKQGVLSAIYLSGFICKMEIFRLLRGWREISAERDQKTQPRFDNRATILPWEICTLGRIVCWRTVDVNNSCHSFV